MTWMILMTPRRGSGPWAPLLRHMESCPFDVYLDKYRIGCFYYFAPVLNRKKILSYVFSNKPYKMQFLYT